ncbi:uncharacterized protein LOC121558851 isoform X1 [Coregonus clupeaformis]|uniref:uncharacterized protein LOC121558851 isoform X1 n=1 Tax=Coregonus clupeaformis TaxID=59861 RepID=UPI001E1C8261|nr:uncharacterized protein LOC121558851 isoform X1 [Coregonus clupeaformis]
MWNDCGSMLLKAKLGDVQKFVRITEPNLKDFLIAAFAKFGVPAVTEGVKIVDSSGTELDDDVFEDIIKDPSTGVLTIKYDSESVSMVASSEQSQPSSLDTLDSEDTVIISDSPSRKRQRLDTEAKQLVESALTNKTGGERIINEYNRTKSLTDETRRKMVNMLAADMTEMNGTSPPRQVKEMYAKGIVTLFPYLSDPFSKNGYEHYYDGESGTGYLAWRIKTIQRGTAKDRRSSFGESAKGSTGEDMSGGPTVRRESQFVPETALTDDECNKAISLMKHSADADTIKKKMELTFVYRRKMILDPQQSSNILSEFPRFKDVKSLVIMLFLNAEQLAGRIHAFDYGYNQQRNRPPRVKLFDGSNDLGLNAIQSWCLLRNMPLLFGDLIQSDDQHWHLLLLLLHIVNIVFSPVLTEGMTIYLKHLIIDHHQLFKQLFPAINLLPKHHL